MKLLAAIVLSIVSAQAGEDQYYTHNFDLYRDVAQDFELWQKYVPSPHGSKVFFDSHTAEERFWLIYWSVSDRDTGQDSSAH